MSDILQTIADATRIRVDEALKANPREEVEAKAKSLPMGNFAFEKRLKAPGISFILECKKASPSKGVIAENFPYLDIARDYEAAGADAISVLTEPGWFKGDIRYLEEISREVSIPTLRKDFVVDSYMIYEAKLAGAGAVLLICSILDEARLKEYIGIADSLGISSLVEAHDEAEADMAILCGARVIGVNNRNLRTFDVDPSNCLRLRSRIPEDIAFVAESGVKTPEDVKVLADNNVNAILIGESAMRSEDKKAFTANLRSLL